MRNLLHPFLGVGQVNNILEHINPSSKAVDGVRVLVICAKKTFWGPIWAISPQRVQKLKKRFINFWALGRSILFQKMKFLAQKLQKEFQIDNQTSDKVTIGGLFPPFTPYFLYVNTVRQMIIRRTVKKTFFKPFYSFLGEFTILCAFFEKISNPQNVVLGV